MFIRPFVYSWETCSSAVQVDTSIDNGITYSTRLFICHSDKDAYSMRALSPFDLCLCDATFLLEAHGKTVSEVGWLAYTYLYGMH